MSEHQALRQRLEERLARIEGRLHHVEQDRRRTQNPLAADWEEQASVRQNDEVLDELATEERQQAEAIRAALQRLDDGTYGICLSCGEPIAANRLAVLPYAVRCVTCAAQAEQRRSR